MPTSRGSVLTKRQTMKSDVLQRILKSLQPRRERLLIVDDNEHLCTLFSEFFEGRGYRVATAFTLAAAEAKLSEESFDLVLQDVLLPDGDGIDFLPRIQMLQPGLLVIVLTGLGYDEPVLQNANENGASGYMSKLLPLDQVLMEVHRVLKTGKRIPPEEVNPISERGTGAPIAPELGCAPEKVRNRGGALV